MNNENSFGRLEEHLLHAAACACGYWLDSQGNAALCWEKDKRAELRKHLTAASAVEQRGARLSAEWRLLLSELLRLLDPLEGTLQPDQCRAVYEVILRDLLFPILPSGYMLNMLARDTQCAFNELWAVGLDVRSEE